MSTPRVSQDISATGAALFQDPPAGEEATVPLGRLGRVDADDRRLWAHAECSAANSTIGTAVAAAGSLPSDLVQMLASVQNDLFDLDSGLIDPLEDGSGTPPARITEEHVARLDRAIEHYGADLQPVEGNVLPGGTMTAALLYQARVAVGRAERATWVGVAHHPDDVDRLAARYLGRLGTLLGVLARLANAEFGDTVWHPMASVTVPQELAGGTEAS